MNDKPVREVRFGEESVVDHIENSYENLYESNLAGVRFATDDEKLHSNFQKAKSDEQLPNLSMGTPQLYYITKSDLHFEPEGGSPLLRAMTVEDLGEIYTSYDLRTFAFAGAGLFGIASSLVYGIRSFCAIEDGYIGLHSSCIYDRERSLAFVIVGDGTLGKSEVSSMLEMEYPERFIMISDDWSEFDLQKGVLRPVSATYSNKLENESSPNYMFTSFGKKFFQKSTNTPRGMELGGIIEVLPKGYDIGIDTRTFVEISMGHIPFVNARRIEQNAIDQLHKGTAQSHLIQLIKHKTDLYIELYESLRNAKLIGRVINDKSAQTTIATIKDYVLSRIISF